MYNKYIKRFIDIIISIISLILFSWLFLILIIAVKLTSKGPVFFCQKRIGLNKSEFNIIKFRTMRIDAPSDVPTHELMNPDDYITVLGRFLRRTSLDELPQILNILFGDMSFVGPRPALWNQYDLITERDKYGINDIKPGLTGWAQVNGRDELPIMDKVKLDAYYVEKLSLFFDIQCVLRTFICVFRQEGIREGM